MGHHFKSAKDYPYLDHPGVIAFAHRGGAVDNLENTMSAFEASVRLGYRYVETDVHVTSDGVLLAFHDDVLDRVTDRAGAIGALPYSEVAKARVGGKEPIPLFDDLLNTWPDLRVNIEPKSDEAVGPLIEAIKKADAIDRVCVGSFSAKRIQQVRDALGERLCTSAGPGEVFRLTLGRFGLPTGRFAAACAQVPIFHKGIRLTNEAFVRAAAANGLQTHVWTVDDPQVMTDLIEMGVTGIMTDKPQILRDVLINAGKWQT